MSDLCHMGSLSEENGSNTKTFEFFFLDNYDSCHEECHGKNDGALETRMDTRWYA